MPSKSKSQQRFFGVVKAMQKGDMSKKGEAGKVAKSMSKDDVDDYASTKHKGKPEKVKRKQRVRELIKKIVREVIDESRVKLATKKDVEFHGNIARLIGKKHSMGLDKKSLLMLLKAVRKHANITFNEGKLNESKVVTLPNGVKVKISFGKVTLIDRRGKIELDRGELQKFGDAIKKHMRIREGFAGALKKEDRKKFDNMRRKQSEVLGYTLTGVNDMKVETDDATIKEAIGKGMKWEDLKVGTVIHWDIGVHYKVTKLSKNKLSSKKHNVLKSAQKHMFADKYNLSKRDFEESIKKGFIRSLTNTNPRIKEGKLTEAKKMKYKKNDWKKINKIAKKKDVMIQTAFGDEFKWEDGSRHGVFGSESDGREIELDHNDIDIVVIEGKLNEAKETIFDVADRVMKDKQAYKYKSRGGQVLVDMQSANLITKVGKKVSSKMKKHLAKMGEANAGNLIQTFWALVK